MIKQNFIINENKTIIDAIKELNLITDVSRLILFVCSDEGKVLGSLTDGDIRRSLVYDGDLNKKLGEICHRDFIYRKDENSFIDLNSVRKKDIKMLPLLNEKQELSKVLDLDKIKSVLPLECMIMAGGRGKRLSPLTDKVPKPMLMLGNKPIIEHNIDRLISFGIQKIYISIKYLGEQIQDYFGDGSNKGIEIVYVWEDEPLGTAGALSLVDNINSEHILLMNSDLLTNVNFEDMYLKLTKEKADMVIASTDYKIDIPYAVFESNGSVISAFKEKPTYIYSSNAGIYMFKTELVSKIPKNKFFDITDLMNMLILEKKKLLHEPIHGYWIDIGKPSDYQNAQEFVKHLGF
ncbi:nucleotidyltransferase family protein [Polaribacter uvawellassae]|uniref:nucleotidyltransferase family protein n=1 Tax=Polaribacter uvawellassae TaxID=3133495 RepID=UPI00321919D2